MEQVRLPAEENSLLRLKGHSLLWFLPLLPHVHRPQVGGSYSYSDSLHGEDEPAATLNSSPLLSTIAAELKGKSLWVGRLCVEYPQALQRMFGFVVPFHSFRWLLTTPPLLFLLMIGNTFVVTAICVIMASLVQHDHHISLSGH